MSYHLTLGPLGTVPIPKWSVHGFGVLALCAAGIWVYHEAVPAPLVTLQQANAALARSQEEYGKHMGETPEHVFADSDGSMSVLVYADHCVAIQRQDGTRTFTRLIVDLARSAVPAVTTWPALVPRLEAGGFCEDPHWTHPGRFQQRQGERRGDWVEIWRRYEDGCEHWQLMSVTGVFEANADGSPKLHWTRCIH